MKRVFIAIAVAFCVTEPVLATNKAEKPNKKNLAQMRETVLRRTGGFLVAPASGRGIRLIDINSGIQEETFKKLTEAISSGPRFAATLEKGSPSKKYMPDDKSGAVIVFVDDASSPMTILTAPEQGWASLNVAPLKSDSPDKERFHKRVCKETWRTLVYMLGGGNNQMPACVMKPCVDVKDIDALKMEQPSPDPFREMSLTAKKLGLAQARLTSYRKACQEGWAPAPANDIQKAIWEEVHAMPTAPIKIKPETKKVRE
jgi:hypothetical protein